MGIRISNQLEAFDHVRLKKKALDEKIGQIRIQQKKEINAGNIEQCMILSGKLESLSDHHADLELLEKWLEPEMNE